MSLTDVIVLFLYTLFTNRKILISEAPKESAQASLGTTERQGQYRDKEVRDPHHRSRDCFVVGFLGGEEYFFLYCTVRICLTWPASFNNTRKQPAKADEH